MKKREIRRVAITIIVVAISVFTTYLLTQTEKIDTYVVSFETDGGTEIDSQRITLGGTIHQPVDPTKEGYIFLGWTYLGETYDFNTEVESNIKLKAQWKEITKGEESIVVKFDSDGGTPVLNQVIEKGQKAEEPTPPTKEGYDFVEWQLDGEKFSFYTVLENDIELKAVWEKEKETNTKKKTTRNEVTRYNVTFDSNGGTGVSSQTVEEGDSADYPATPYRDGYNFVGWQWNGSNYNFGSPVYQNIYLVAVWEEIPQSEPETPPEDNQSDEDED